MGANARRLGAVTSNGGGPESSRPTPPPLPDAPAWLGDEARQVWDRLAPLVPDSKLTPATADAFALLCVSVATYAEAHEIIATTGLLIAQGQDLIPSPALAIRNQQDPTVARWLKTFGLTPDTPPPAKPGRGYRPHLVES